MTGVLDSHLAEEGPRYTDSSFLSSIDCCYCQLYFCWAFLSLFVAAGFRLT